MCNTKQLVCNFKSQPLNKKKKKKLWRNWMNCIARPDPNPSPLFNGVRRSRGPCLSSYRLWWLKETHDESSKALKPWTQVWNLDSIKRPQRNHQFEQVVVFYILFFKRLEKHLTQLSFVMLTWTWENWGIS